MDKDYLLEITKSLNRLFKLDYGDKIQIEPEKEGYRIIIEKQFEIEQVSITS